MESLGGFGVAEAWKSRLEMIEPLPVVNKTPTSSLSLQVYQELLLLHFLLKLSVESSTFSVCLPRLVKFLFLSLKRELN